VLRVT